LAVGDCSHFDLNISFSFVAAQSKPKELDVVRKLEDRCDQRETYEHRDPDAPKPGGATKQFGVDLHDRHSAADSELGTARVNSNQPHSFRSAS
jgi:hypothetical protein